jgi:hypothetical protein
MRLYVSFSVTPLDGLSLEATIWPAFSVLSNCWPAPIELRGCRTTSVGSRRRTAQGHSRRGSGCAWPNDRESGYDRLDIDGSIGSRAPSLPHRRQDPAGWITPGQTSARPGRVPKPGLDREKAGFFLCGTLSASGFFKADPTANARRRLRRAIASITVRASAPMDALHEPHALTVLS